MADLAGWLKALPAVAALRARLGGGVSRRFSSGSFWLGVGLAAWRLPSAITTILVGRILGPTGFGELGMVNSTVQMFADYGSLGVGPTTARYMAHYRQSDPGKAARVLKLTTTLSLAVCLLVAGGMALGAPTLAGRVLNRPELALPVAIGGALLLFLVMTRVREFALHGLEWFSRVTRVNVARGLVTPLVCLPLAWYWSVTGAIAGLAIVAAFAFVLMSVQLRRSAREAGLPEHVSFRDSSSEMSVMWTYALPGALTGAVMALALWLGRLMITQAPDGYTQLGLFEAANQWRMLVLFVPDVLSRAVMPILSASFGAGADGDFRRAVRLQFLAICTTATPAVIVAIGASQLLTQIFGARFAAAAPVIPILMMALFFYALNQAVRQTYNAVGRRWVNFNMYLLWGLVVVAASSVLVPRLGAQGLAWAMLAGEGLLFAVQCAFVESRLFPGAIRPSAGILMLSLGAIALQYAAWQLLPGPWPLVSALALGMAAMAPAAYRLRYR